MVAAACSSGGGSGGAAATPARPGEVRIAVGEDIWPLTGTGPTSRSFAAGELSVGVYEPLLALGPDDAVRPGLAERWELVSPTTWRFHLRPSVRFHDGRPFGADDVVWSWTGRELMPRSVSATLDKVVKVDDLTVDFVTSVPNLRLPEQVVHPEGPIVPRGGHNDSTPPVGTGPFKVVDYRPRQQVVVERNDDYWGDKAKAHRLTFRFMPDPQVRADALRSGEVDMAVDLAADALAAVGADRMFHVVRAPIGATQVLAFGSSGPLSADQALRQAVSLAVDRNKYVADVLGGTGEPGRWTAPPAVLGAAADTVGPSPFDPDRARRLLDDAGWKPGPDGVRANGSRRLDVTMVAGPGVPEAGARLVAGELRDVGIGASVKKAADTVTYQQYRDKGFDLDLTMPNQNDANPAFLVAGRTSPDAEYAALIATSVSAADRADVQRAAAAMMRIIVNRDFTLVPVAGVARTYAMRAGVELAQPHPSAINQTWTSVSTS